MLASASLSSLRRSYKSKLTPSGSKILNAQTTLDSASALIDASASRGSWYEILAWLGSKVKWPTSPPNAVSVTRFGSAWEIVAQSSKEKESPTSFDLISADESRQLWTIRSGFNRSELEFISCAESFGIK